MTVLDRLLQVSFYDEDVHGSLESGPANLFIAIRNAICRQETQELRGLHIVCTQTSFGLAHEDPASFFFNSFLLAEESVDIDA